MKILAVKTNSGSNFHRLVLPLSYLKVDFVDTLVEEVVKNYQVLWLHYSTKVSPYMIGIWKAKYRIKVIIDIDDSWNISRDHVSYKSLQPVVQRSKELVVIADHVICSTPELVEMVRPYNESVFVVPNGIPWNEGQYQIWNESLKDFINRPIRIGICGSASHFEDWESIRGQIKRCLSDGELKKCEWVVGGVPDMNKVPEPDWMRDHPQRNELYKKHVLYNKKVWDDICSIFGKPKRIINREVQDYIDIYREIDIMLCPLVNNHSNICRSNLKVLECAVTNTIPVLGELYRDKSVLNQSHLFGDWYKNLKFLVKDKKALYNMKLSSSQYIRDNHNYQKECIEPRLRILEESKKEKELNIWGITYNGQFTEYQEYVNTVNTIEDKSYLFEYNAILNLIK